MKFTHTISEEKVLNRPIDWLFDFTQDFDERKKWDKQTKGIAFMDGFHKLEKGAKVYTVSAEGIKMETEYVSFDRPKEISIIMLNRSSLFNGFYGNWSYTSMDDSNTSLAITYQFNLRLPYALVQSFVLKRIRENMKNKLRFLEAHLDET